VEKPQKLLSYANGGLPYSKAVTEAGQQQQQANSTSTVSTAAVAAAVSSAQFERPQGFQACMAVRFRNMKWVGETGKVYRCVLVLWRIHSCTHAASSDAVVN
jgi:hypothetical protein